MDAETAVLQFPSFRRSGVTPFMNVGIPK